MANLSNFRVEHTHISKASAEILVGSNPGNVLITGGCGFIGSNFINYIFNKWPSSKFVNFDKLAYGASPDHVETNVRESSRYSFVKASLLDQSIVESLLAKNQIDTVIHFAAITHVDDSYADRDGTISENIMSTLRLLEAVKNYKKLKRFVHISTDEVYGDSAEGSIPKTESSPLNPTNPYAASKAACEMLIISYHHSYQLPYVMVRMNNVYGPRQAYSKLIPKFIKLALERKPYPLMGDGMHCRSWMYVNDCAEAIRRITERGEFGQVYNIGTEFEIPNLHLTEILHAKVEKLMSRQSTKIQFQPVPDRPYHDRRYYIDFSKIRSELNWNCAITFDDGLNETLTYYLKQYKMGDKNFVSDRPFG